MTIYKLYLRLIPFGMLAAEVEKQLSRVEQERLGSHSKNVAKYELALKEYVNRIMRT